MTGKYGLNVNRELFILGSATEVAHIRTVLAPLTFLVPVEISQLEKPRTETHFIVGCADFSNLINLHSIARTFTALNSSHCHKLLFATAPEKLAREHLLFGAELGARYTAQGGNRDEDLRKYIKKICLDLQEASSVPWYEQEMVKAYNRGDEPKLEQIAARLGEMPKDNEEVLRALVLVNQYLGSFDKVEFYLKKMLALNAQNLWAANGLGRMFLRSGRAADGIELLEKMSQFHEINSERLLDLGTAYLNVGEAGQARQVLQKGEKLTGGQDGRFAEGLAKASTIDGNPRVALSLLPKPYSIDLVAFLNMRAIIQIKAGKIQEGLDLYDIAWSGIAEERVLKSKLRFNMGLGFLKAGKLEDAIKCFEESTMLGGVEFGRAAKPLTIVRNVVATQHKQGKPVAATGEVMRWSEEMEWERV